MGRSSRRIQSPMAIDDSSCMATPDKRLPSVSCSARPITAVSTADVVMIDSRFTPERDRIITIATSEATVTDRSRRILGDAEAAADQIEEHQAGGAGDGPRQRHQRHQLRRRVARPPGRR